MHQNVLVTGGGGFIGTTLVRKLLDRGFYVDVIDKKGYAFREDFFKVNPELWASANPSPHFSQFGNLNEFSEVDAQHWRLAYPERYDYVIILHAESHVDNSLKSGIPFFESNVLGTVNVLEQFKNVARKQAKFLVFSTDEVLGETFPDYPATENHRYAPKNPYAASKAGQEMAARAYSVNFDMPMVITRCTNIYGPGQHTEKFIPRSIELLADDKPLKLYGEGAESREWVYVDDICSGVLKILGSWPEAKTIAHFSGANSVTNMQLAKLLCTLMNKDPEKYIELVPNRLGHDKSYSLDSGLTKYLFGWEPTTAMVDGLRTTIEYVRARKGN